jgi:hypothetical protein
MRPLVAIAALAAGGCATVLGIDSDRQVASGEAGADAAAGDAAGKTDAGPPSGPWDCLQRPDQILDPQLHVDVTVVMTDPLGLSVSANQIDGGSDLVTVSGTWLTGVAIQSCDLRDTECLAGRQQTVTDDAGRATFHETGDFRGYFDMRRADLVPVTLYPGNLLAGATTEEFPAYTLNGISFAALARDSTPVAPCLDPAGDAGHALVTIYDCNDHQAAGVHVDYSALTDASVPFYLSAGLPSLTAQATDSFGLAGAINLPIGTVTASASFAGDGGDGSVMSPAFGRIRFDVHPGAISLAFIRVRSH